MTFDAISIKWIEGHDFLIADKFHPWSVLNEVHVQIEWHFGELLVDVLRLFIGCTVIELLHQSFAFFKLFFKLQFLLLPIVLRLDVSFDKLKQLSVLYVQVEIDVDAVLLQLFSFVEQFLVSLGELFLFTLLERRTNLADSDDLRAQLAATTGGSRASSLSWAIFLGLETSSTAFFLDLDFDVLADLYWVRNVIASSLLKFFWNLQYLSDLLSSLHSISGSGGVTTQMASF